MDAFSGFLTYPAKFANIGILIVDTDDSKYSFAKKCSKLGYMTIVLESKSSIEEIKAGVDFLYRFCEKILFIPCRKSVSQINEYVQAIPILDGIMIFDSYEDIVLAVSDSIKLQEWKYIDTKKQSQALTKTLFYTDVDLIVLQREDVSSADYEGYFWRNFVDFLQYL